MKSPGVLNEGTLPRNRHSEKKGVQPCVVETLTDEATGCEQKPFFGFRNRFQLLADRSSLFDRTATVKHDDVLYQAPKALIKKLQMLLSLGQ